MGWREEYWNHFWRYGNDEDPWDNFPPHLLVTPDDDDLIERDDCEVDEYSAEEDEDAVYERIREERLFGV